MEVPGQADPEAAPESPTTHVRIQIPPSVASATPAVHPGWSVATKEGKKDPVELHGEEIGASVDDDSAPTWLTIAALGLGALGLVAGIAGQTVARRRTT